MHCKAEYIVRYQLYTTTSLYCSAHVEHWIMKLSQI